VKVVDLVQRSPAWYQWRRQGLGSSDAPILWHGKHFRRTIVQLWQEKVGLGHKEAPNPAMRREADLEPTIRDWYEQTIGVAAPALCAQHDVHPWMKGSLDGFVSGVQAVLELKYANKAYHEEALAGRVPDAYLPQVHHQLLVTGAAVAHYVSHNPSYPPDQAFALVEHTPDATVLAELVAVEEQFWGHVVHCTPPPNNLR
jgi:putative phage-type endonuclease